MLVPRPLPCGATGEGRVGRNVPRDPERAPGHFRNIGKTPRHRLHSSPRRTGHLETGTPFWEKGGRQASVLGVRAGRCSRSPELVTRGRRVRSAAGVPRREVGVSHARPRGPGAGGLGVWLGLQAGSEEATRKITRFPWYWEAESPSSPRLEPQASQNLVLNLD